jgi:hypothetical protein
MIQFTIRDLMWAMIVAAFALCWYLEREGRQGLRERAMVLHQKNEELRLQWLTASTYRLHFQHFQRKMGDQANAEQSSQTE